MKLSLERLFLFVPSAPGSPTTNSLKFFLLRTSRWCARSSTFTRCWFFKFDVVWVVINDSNGINRCSFFNLLFLLHRNRLNRRSARRNSTCNFLLFGLNEAGRAFSVKDVVVGSWEVLLEQAQDYPLMERQWQLRPHQDQSNQRLDPIPPVDLVDRPNFPLRCCCCCTPNCCCSNRSKSMSWSSCCSTGNSSTRGREPGGVNVDSLADGSPSTSMHGWAFQFRVWTLKTPSAPKAALYRPLTKLVAYYG